MRQVSSLSLRLSFLRAATSDVTMASQCPVCAFYGVDAELSLTLSVSGSHGTPGGAKAITEWAQCGGLCGKMVHEGCGLSVRADELIWCCTLCAMQCDACYHFVVYSVISREVS